MDDSSAPEKSCSSCGEWKPFDDFHRRAASEDGLQYRCKQCDSAARRLRKSDTAPTARMRATREVSRRQVLATGLKACARCTEVKVLDEFQRHSASLDGFNRLCKACRRNEKAESYERTRERTLAANREYRLANPDMIRASLKRWRSDHPDARRRYRAKRRALMSESRVGHIDMAELWNGVCGICSTALDASLLYPDPASKSLDHITPLARGGTHEQSNLQWTHLRCNIRKGARLIG